MKQLLISKQSMKQFVWLNMEEIFEFDYEKLFYQLKMLNLFLFESKYKHLKLRKKKKNGFRDPRILWDLLFPHPTRSWDFEIRFFLFV